jgi:hypothetical protein
MRLKEIYGIKMGNKHSIADAILGLLPGVPLMMTKNIDIKFGTFLSLIILTNYFSIGFC